MGEKKYKETIEGIVKSSVDMAIDQAHEYGGLEGAFNSYLQNLRDTLREYGYDHDEDADAMDLFRNEFKKRTGLSW